MRRAWIEIKTFERMITHGNQSLSVRRAWIEIGLVQSAISGIQSLSVRRAWIEI